MLPGCRVRIARPPEDKKDLKHKTGRSVTLIPYATLPLRYRVLLDDDDDDNNDNNNNNKGRVYEFPFTCLDVIEYEEQQFPEEGRTGGNIGMMQVNGLNYCASHRMEVCDQCQLDYRASNLEREISEDEKRSRNMINVEQVTQFFLQLTHIYVKQKWAPRRAPSKNAAASAATTKFAIRPDYPPVLTDELILIPPALDPDTLPLWPKEMPFETCFQTMVEGPEESSIPHFAKPVLFRVRDRIMSAAYLWEQFIEEETKGGGPRIFVEDGVQSQAIILDVVLPVRVMEVSSTLTLPLFVVRWAHVVAGPDPEKHHNVMASLEPGTPMLAVRDEHPQRHDNQDEIVFLDALLKRNATRLDPTVLKRYEKCAPFLSVSVLTPIPFMNQQFYYSVALDGKFCHQCGNTTQQPSTPSSDNDNENNNNNNTSQMIDLLKCARCNSVWYCSSECQKKHWKFHKTTCEAENK